MSPGLRNDGQFLAVHLHTVGHDYVRAENVEFSEMNHRSLSKLGYKTLRVVFRWRHVETQPNPMFGG